MTALNRPNLIARSVTVLVATACVVVIVIALTSGGSSYVLNLRLSNASGLRPGSQVLVGGVPVGTVGALNLRGSVVTAPLDLNPAQVRVGRGASASITAANLLGEEYVALNPGDGHAPLPSGATLPESATTPPTDLDQVVDVLDAPTRADLAVLLNEAGLAVAGRRADVSAILRQIPLSFSAATRLLTQLVQDNHTLTDAVANSDQFISRIDAQAGDLKRVIGSSSQAAGVLAARAADLRQTVTGGPSAVATLTRVLDQGAPVVHELIGPAGDVADAAPLVNRVLSDVRPFTAAAVPSLNRAAAVAPTLDRLAVKATPTVAAALPTVTSLQNIARLAQPLSTWLGLSSQDFFNVFAGWSRAIQFRDGLGHIFNGDVNLNPEIVLNVADRDASPAQRRQNLLDVLNPTVLRTMGLLGAARAARNAPATTVSHLLSLAHGSAKSPATTHVPPTSTPVPTSPAGGGSSSTPAGGLAHLLSGLLGGHGGSGSSGAGKGGSSGSSGSGGSGGSGSGGTGSGGGGAPASSLAGLLSYLLGR